MADGQKENRTAVLHETEYQRPGGLEQSFRENALASILVSASDDAEQRVLLMDPVLPGTGRL